jgi:hypothetical protein
MPGIAMAAMLKIVPRATKTGECAGVSGKNAAGARPAIRRSKYNKRICKKRRAARLGGIAAAKVLPGTASLTCP